MANPNAIVSIVIRSLRDERGPSVELENGRHARLNPADRRSAGFAQILDGLRDRKLPVYLEVDPATSAITRLLIPHVTRIAGVQPIEEGSLAVELELSQARHLLRRGQPDFAELERQLRDAVRIDPSFGEIVDPVIHGPSPLYGYEPGTWGPKEAEALTAPVGGWNTPT